MIRGKLLPSGCVLVFASLYAGVCSAQGPVLQDAQRESRFQRTLQYVQGSSDEERAGFTGAALTELIAVYMAEADLARADAAQREPAARGKLLGWSQAVNLYAEQLLLLLDDVEQGFPVSLRLERHGSLTASVADRTVIFAHPRATQQAAYEMRVLKDFCSNYDCQRMTVTAQESAPIPAAAVGLTPLWTFTARGPVCSYDAIEIQFQSSKNLPIKRGLCVQLMREVTALSRELAWQGRHGVVIDWAALAVTATEDRTEHLVSLNTLGDAVVVKLPLLFAAPLLLADITGWLSFRAAGKEPLPISLRAESYGWEVPEP